MSGGSFNYLCWADLTEREGDVQSMAHALAQYSGHALALEHTKKLLSLMEEIKALREKLWPVWREIEWHHSGDTSEADVIEALATYKG